METMITPQVGMRLRAEKKFKKEKKDAIKKGEGPKNKKMREKERRDNATILLPHLCFKVAPLSS